MLNNAHIHLFSTDHTPSVQLYYLMRGALHKAARKYLPPIIGHKVGIEDLQQLDSSMDRFEWPWPLLFKAAVDASSIVGGIGLIDPHHLIDMFVAVSRMTRDDARGILGVNDSEKEGDFLQYLEKETNAFKQADEPFPFQQALCKIISKLFEAHKKGVGLKGSLGQKEVWNTFLQSPGANQYKRFVVLSVNFDEAFLNDDFPGLSSTPDLDFTAQMGDLENLAQEVNADGEKIIVPFLCIDPRGYTAETLEAFVREHVGKDKPWKGLKIYPPMGILPIDELLNNVFDFCQDFGIPITSHCSIGGAGVRGSDRNFADLAQPMKWQGVLERLEKRNERKGVFRLCLAHLDSMEDPDNLSWCGDIIKLMTRFDGSKGVEVFADISYNLILGESSRAQYDVNVKKIRDLGLQKRIFFGTDWWMYLYECTTEKEFINQLKIDGDNCWWKTDELDQATDSFLQDVLP